MYPPLARGPDAGAELVVSPVEVPSSFVSCSTSAMESARAMLSARAMESCFDRTGPACPCAMIGDIAAIAKSIKRPFILENPFFCGVRTGLPNARLEPSRAESCLA
jgi:hypothetical protein